MLDGIGSIVGRFWDRARGRKRVEPVARAEGGKVETDTTEEQIQYSNGKRVEAGLYGKDGQVPEGTPGPKLDERA